MADLVDGLKIRKALGPKDWGPPRLMGPDGFAFTSRNGEGTVIVTGWYEPDDGDLGWLHASISRTYGVPSYDDLVMLHRAVWHDGHAYQVFVPPSEHVNIHPRALHLWGRADGRRVLPDFAKNGTI